MGSGLGLANRIGVLVDPPFGSFPRCGVFNRAVHRFREPSFSTPFLFLVFRFLRQENLRLLDKVVEIAWIEQVSAADIHHLKLSLGDELADLPQRNEEVCCPLPSSYPWW